jgi:hypothetical protein
MLENPTGAAQYVNKAAPAPRSPATGACADFDNDMDEISISSAGTR